MTFYKKNYTHEDLLRAALEVMRTNDNRKGIESGIARADLRRVIEKLAYDDSRVDMLFGEGRISGAFDYYRLARAKEEALELTPKYILALVAVLLFEGWSKAPWLGLERDPLEWHTPDPATRLSKFGWFTSRAVYLDCQAPAPKPLPRRYGPIETETRKILYGAVMP